MAERSPSPTLSELERTEMPVAYPKHWSEIPLDPHELSLNDWPGSAPPSLFSEIPEAFHSGAVSWTDEWIEKRAMGYEEISNLLKLGAEEPVTNVPELYESRESACERQQLENKDSSNAEETDPATSHETTAADVARAQPPPAGHFETFSAHTMQSPPARAVPTGRKRPAGRTAGSFVAYNPPGSVTTAGPSTTRRRARTKRVKRERGEIEPK